MSTTLVILASILGISALVLIPFMMVKGTQQKDGTNTHANQGKTNPKKKKRR